MKKFIVKKKRHKMADLLSPQQELAARIYADTSSLSSAAEAVGCTPSTARKWWKENRLFRQAVRQRLELMAKKYSVNKENVIAELAKIGFTRLEDVVEWDEEGNVKVKGLLKIDPRAGAAIAEIMEETGKGGRKLKVKLHDKKAALDSLGRSLGMFTDKVESKDDTTLTIKSVSYADAKIPNPSPLSLKDEVK